MREIDLAEGDMVQPTAFKALGGRPKPVGHQGRQAPAMAATEGARDVALALLAIRATEATVCPSEVARALVGAAAGESVEEDWRSAMPAVHLAVDRLLAEGLVRLSWKGRVLTTRAGPYRIGRGGKDRV